MQLSDQQGVLVKDVADSLGIHSFMLSKGRKQVRDRELVGKPPPIEPVAVAELQRLRDVKKRFRACRLLDLGHPENGLLEIGWGKF